MIQYYVDVVVCPNSAVQIVRNSRLTEIISKLLNYQIPKFPSCRIFKNSIIVRRILCSVNLFARILASCNTFLLLFYIGSITARYFLPLRLAISSLYDTKKLKSVESTSLQYLIMLKQLLFT